MRRGRVVNSDGNCEPLVGRGDAVRRGGGVLIFHVHTFLIGAENQLLGETCLIVAMGMPQIMIQFKSSALKFVLAPLQCKLAMSTFDGCALKIPRTSKNNVRNVSHMYKGMTRHQKPRLRVIVQT
jgi:hypothetical protein